MTFTTDTFARAAFKIGQGLAHTSSTRDPANEAESSSFTLALSEIFGDTISSDPDTAVSSGIAAYMSLRLEQDVGNTLAYLAYIDGAVAGTELENKINPRTGSNYDNNDRVGYLIPPKFGTGYRAILRDGATEIPPLSSEDWFFDYRAGIVNSETALSLADGYIDGYVYIGTLGAGSSSPWTTSGNGIDYTTTLNSATGDETAVNIDYTVNKATSGADYGLLINKTDASSPGTSSLLDMQVGGSSVYQFTDDGTINITDTDFRFIASGVMRIVAGSSIVLDPNITFNPSTEQIVYTNGRTTSTNGMHYFKSGTSGYLNASSGNQGFMRVVAAINQSGTAGYTALRVEANETGVGTGESYLLDLQLDGTSQFSVGNGGRVNASVTDLDGSFANESAVFINPTITQSGTAGYTALEINVDEGTTGSGDGYLLHGIVDGYSVFSVESSGYTTIYGGITSSDNFRSEVFGDGAFTQEARSVALGYAAGARPGHAVAIGDTARVESGGLDSVAIGYSANVSGANSVGIGSGAGSGGGESVAIGKQALAYNGAIAIGSGSQALSAGRFVAGSSTVAMTDIYFGDGVTNASPSGYVIHGTGGSGTNVAGGNLTIAGGAGTGTGVGGDILFQTAPAGASGSTANALSTVMTITDDGYVEADQVCVAWAELAVAAGAVTITDNVNVAGVSVSGTDMRVSFETARPDSNYCILVSQDNSTVGSVYGNSIQTTGFFELIYYNTSFVATSWSSFSGDVWVAVFDRRT